MGLPFGGITNLTNLSSMGNMKNLTNLTGMGGMGNMSNLMNMMGGNLTEKVDASSLDKMGGLEDFIGSADNPNLLKGIVTKIQQGDSIQDVDLEGLSEKDAEFANDLNAIKGSDAPQEVADSFSELMGKYINNVDQKHKVAENAIETFASGGNIDVHSVMIAAEQANLSMQLTMQLRNKIVQAYQEINNIRV